MIVNKKKIKQIIREEISGVLLEQFTGDHLIAAVQAVEQSRTDASIKNQITNPRAPEMMLAKELIDLGMGSQVSNIVANKEITPDLINQVLKLIFTKVKDRPDTGKMGMFDQFFNLDDNILDTLDDQTVNDIMTELERVMRDASVAPGTPLEMTLPMIRDIFMQILYQKTGLAPAPMGM
tara:strand:- start:2067 stop:2603 length:537 start_codon:yes stop_codon:yes gene_type:complete